MKNLKKISRNKLKNIQGGYGPEPPCGDSWSASMSTRCGCITTGGMWFCDKCLTNVENQITAELSNTCEEYNDWPK